LSSSSIIQWVFQTWKTTKRKREQRRKRTEKRREIAKHNLWKFICEN